jgi:apolipoprotein N-acyltransferase
MYATWALLATYCALFLPVGVLLVRSLDRRTRLPLVITLPAVWVALEYFRAHFATGFSWYLLGHTQHDFLPVIQVADLGGVYAVTALVAAVNALLFELLYARGRFRTLFALAEPLRPSRSPRQALALQAAGVVALLAGALAYGGWRLSQNHFEAGPSVALVQGNLGLGLKNEAWSGEEGAKAASAAVKREAVTLSDISAPHRPRLIVWPETSWPDEWIELLGDKPRPAAVSGELARDAATRWQTNLLLGLNTVVAAPDGRVRCRYNSAVFVRDDGTYADRYDKIHCVPFGEYVPFRETLPFMNAFSPYDFDYSVRPGERLTRFPLEAYHFGVLICYEDTVSDFARLYALADGAAPAADFLLNTSNDGWFDGSAEHEQHLACCRFRAVEARRSVGRAVNMGVSAVIDPNGRVLAPQETERHGEARLWEVPAGAAELPVGRWAEFKKVPGVLVAAMPIDHRTSVYALAGDWLPWGCWLFLAGGLLAAFLSRRAARAAAN